MYPKYRYNINNVILVCSIQHHEMIDKTSAWIKFVIENMIKNNILPTFKSLLDIKNG